MLLIGTAKAVIREVTIENVVEDTIKLYLLIIKVRLVCLMISKSFLKKR